MKKLNINSNRLAYLKTFFQNHLTLKARISLLSSYNVKFPDWFEISVLIFEYLQLISQIVLFVPELYEASDNSFIIRIVIYACKLVNVSWLLSFTNTDSTTGSMIAIVLIFTVLKYLILLYVIAIAYLDLKGIQAISKTWRLIFKMQGRVLCYFIASFWVKTILAVKNDGFKLYDLGPDGATAVMSILWSVEYIFSFLIETQFCDVLPRKNFLSSKNFQLQLTTLSQKMIIHIFQLALGGTLKSRIWISAVFILIFSMSRIQRFFATLPLYRMQALLVQAKMDSIVLGFSIAYFFEAILLSSNYDEPSVKFVVVTGFILSLLLTIVSQGLLQECIVRLFSTKMAKNLPDLLLHKPILLKQLWKIEHQVPEESPKYHWTFLASRVMNQDIIFGNLDCEIPEETNKVFLGYFEKLAMKFPKHKLTQLYFSNMGIKRMRISSKSLKSVSSIVRKPWSREYLSAIFLLCKFREILVKNSKESKGDCLEHDGYLRIQKHLTDLKEKIVNQAEMQISICRNILNDKCDIGDIFEKSQDVSRSRALIRREMKNISGQVPEYFVEFLLLCAQYFLVLEFSQSKYQRYCENYHIRYTKFKKYLISPDLSEENLYQNTNAFLILAGQGKDNGKVKYCSKSTEQVLGGDSQSYISSHMASLFLPSMQTYYHSNFQQMFENGDQIQLLNKVQTAFLCHKSGYMVKAQIFLQVHPNLNENIFLSMIIRSTSILTEYLILKENGEIEGATKRVFKQLGMNTIGATSSINIKHISEELALVNEAFNMIYGGNSGNKVHAMNLDKSLNLKSPNKMGPNIFLNHDQALEICEFYLNEGREMELKPLNPVNSLSPDKEVRHMYQCNVSMFSFQDTSMKLVKLSRASRKTKLVPEDILPSARNFKFRAKNQEPLSTERYEETDGEYETPASSLRMKKTLATDAGLLSTISPRSPMIPLLATARKSDPLFFTECKASKEEDELSDNRTEFSKAEGTNQQEGENLADFLSVTSMTFKKSQEKAVYRAYRSRIIQKSYSNSFKFLCLAFYGVIFIVL